MMMKLTRSLTAFAALLLFWSVNATPTFTISGHSLTAVGMNGDTEVVIPDGVTCIVDFAFSGCYDLTSLTIPASVTSIGGAAFDGCGNLSMITFIGDQPFISSGTFDYVSRNCIARLPRGNSTYAERNGKWCGLTVERYDPSDAVVAWTINSGELSDVDLNGETDVTIPSSVTRIGVGAFRYCRQNLTSVIIPDTVTSIGANAFSDCRKLAVVIIGSGVNRIESNAFSGCESLKSVIFLGEGLPVCDSGAFDRVADGCAVYVDDAIDGFKEGDIWNRLTVLKASLPSDSDSLSKPIFTVDQYGELTHVELNGVTRIIIPAKVMRVRGYAFRDCYDLTSIAIVSTVERIESGAFEHLDSLKRVTVGGSVAEIDGHIFADCNELTTVTLGCGLTRIGDGMFQGCRSLTNINIPNSMTSIGYAAFQGCEKLSSVTIPNGVANIGEGAFSGCGCLTNISVDAESVNYSSANGLLLSKDGHILIQGVNGDVSIPMSVTNIGERSFYDCSGLKSVAIGDSVISIGKCAFFGCSGLRSVTIGKGVVSIGDGAFYCKSLMSITIDSGNARYSSANGLLLTKDGRSLIQGVNGAVRIPDGIVWIEDRAFSGCSSLSNVMMPDSVTSIGGSAFLSCTSLTNVTIGNGVTFIGSCAFQRCTKLSSIEIPHSVQNIEEYAFSNCNSLTNVTIVPGVTNIGTYAFDGCGGLTSVTLPESVASVGSCAFSFCKHLSLALLPSHLRGSVSLDDQFRSCASDLRVLFYDGKVNDAECIVVGLDANGGGVAQSVVKTLKGYSVGGLPEPTRAHYSFSGWFTKVLGGDQVTAETVLNESATLYAHWVPLGETLYTDNGVRLKIEDGLLFSVELCGETEVTIPCCVTAIDSCAFDGCSSMMRVTLPDSVTNIVAGAFRSCCGLSLALLPSRLKANVSGLFGNCASDFQVLFYDGCVDDVELIAVTFDANGGSLARSSVWAIEGCAIGDLPICSREGYIFLGWYTEVKGGGLVTSKTILNGNEVLHAHWVSAVRTIVSNWIHLYIDNCVLTRVDIVDYPPEVIVPKWVTRIDDDAFQTFGRIVTDVTIPNSVTSIDERTFDWCSKIKNVTIPQCVVDRGLRSVFPDAYESITNVVIAEGATSIGYSAFSGCDGVTRVTIPNSVTNISPYALWGCANLSLAFVPSRLEDDLMENRYNKYLPLVFYDESDWLTVRFDANGGVGDLDVLLVSADRGGVRGYAIGHLPMFTDPYFLGWFTDAEGGERVTEETILQNSMTLYAHWAPRPIYVWAYLVDSNLSFISGGTTNSEMMVLPVFLNDDGVYTTNITYWVRDGFEIAEVLTNGAKVVEASGERGKWTLELSLREAKNLTVVASSRLIGSDGLPELKSDVEPEIVAAAMAGVTDMSLLANVTNAAQYLDYRNWALAMTNETVTAQMVKQSDKAWLSFALGVDALIVKDFVSDDVKIEEFTPAATDGSFEFTVGVEGVNVGAGSVAEETLKTNLKKVIGLEGGTSLDELSADKVDITFSTPVEGKVKFTAGPNSKNADAKTFFMKVKLIP